MRLDVTKIVFEIIEVLSDNMDSSLETRVRAEVRKRLTGPQIENIAVQLVTERTRDYARQRAVKVERKFTSLLPVRDLSTLHQGHTGRAKPGSLAESNSCANCISCREARERQESLRKIRDEYEIEVRKKIIVEWTFELLETEIAMPDGTRTTWGNATLDQHEIRRTMLADSAMANMEAAARHANAIEQLKSSGASNLAALVSA